MTQSDDAQQGCYFCSKVLMSSSFVKIGTRTAEKNKKNLGKNKIADVVSTTCKTLEEHVGGMMPDCRRENRGWFLVLILTCFNFLLVIAELTCTTVL